MTALSTSFSGVLCPKWDMSFNDDPSKDSLDWDGRVRGTNKGCLKAFDHNWYTP